MATCRMRKWELDLGLEIPESLVAVPQETFLVVAFRGISVGETGLVMLGLQKTMTKPGICWKARLAHLGVLFLKSIDLFRAIRTS